MKLKEKNIAVRLRKNGSSYSEILKKIKVSKSTISIWLRDIQLTPDQQKRLLKGRDLSRYIGAKTKQKNKEKAIKKLIGEGEKEFINLVKNHLFLIGLALYWAEGDKHKGERVKFTNSDEKLIILMMRWFREICQVPEEKFRIALHIHNLHSKPNIKKHWVKITGISEKKFNKIYIKKTSLRQRRNILYNGTCGIVINNKSLFRRISGWKIGLAKYFNISSPRSSTDRTRDF